MNFHTRPIVSPEAEEMLEDLAESLEISESRYEQAEKRYKSLGEWLNRPESTIRQYDPQVHVQGSFGLGTVTPPLTDNDEYDVDAVCEFRRLTKAEKTQAQLKEMLEVEMRAYARDRGMVKPLEEHRRCWRQSYADGAQFHIDVTPAVLSGGELTAMLKMRLMDTSLASTGISIADNKHPRYRVITQDWQRSNPRGYLKWFLTRMGAVYEKRKGKLIQKGIRAGTEPIPDYRVRTPLQQCIMILKRHRDIMFIDHCDDKPISIILTTLSAHSYEGQEKLSDALFAILSKMDSFIERRADGSYVIANPSDPLENFADKWKEHPERALAFETWFARARSDFARIAVLSNKQLIADYLETGVGRNIADRVRERAAKRLSAPNLLTQGLVSSAAAARQAPPRIEGDRRNA
ncbi:hypothetical protein V1281_001596 [Nitrobacteraceae bacterium AZCC 2161]